jgi:hypothetical protein
MTIHAFIAKDGETGTLATSGSDYKLTIRAVQLSGADLLFGDAMAAASDTSLSPYSVDIGGKILIRQKIGPGKQLASNAWEFEVSYGEEDEDKSDEDPTAGSWKLKWTTGKTQQKLVRAKQLISAQTSSEGMYPLKELNLVMTWDGKEAKGIDVPFAEPTFQIVKYYAAASVTTEAFQNLCSAASPPRTNNGVWLGFAAGEVAYFGASAEADIPLRGGISRTKPIPITLDYGYSPNLTSIAVGNGITVASKKGWEVLDVRYIKEADGDSLVPKPIHAHVWRVFDEMDYATFFGIGGS